MVMVVAIPFPSLLSLLKKIYKQKVWKLCYDSQRRRQLQNIIKSLTDNIKDEVG